MIIRPHKSSVYSAPHPSGVADWASVLSVDAQPPVAPRSPPPPFPGGS